ncbi:hypothetical protein K1719_029151 [Acacia pycnantha]|nr:hypothetical protein K1719_029151 [Acacia pycnantha]
MASTSQNGLSNQKQNQGLSFTEYCKGWSVLLYETLFEKISSRHLKSPLPLPPFSDLTIILTGPTSGIGLEVARNLAFSGAHLVMAARNTKAAHDLINQWNHERSYSSSDDEAKQLLDIEVMKLDLLSLQSVVNFAQEWNSRSKPVNVLINNAGILTMGKPQSLSEEDGFETHLQVNHLAPSLLTMLLLPSLKKGSPSRIVNNSSTGHFLGFVDIDDMNFTSGRRKFSSFKGYSSSKLAQVMFSSILQKMLPAESGISVVCASPGSVRYTNVKLETSIKVWENTLDMIGLPSDAVDKLLNGNTLEVSQKKSVVAAAVATCGIGGMKPGCKVCADQKLWTTG